MILKEARICVVCREGIPSTRGNRAKTCSEECGKKLEEERYRSRYRKNRERILEGKKIYYKENREKLLEVTKKYHRDNREDLNSLRKSNYYKNHERGKIRSKEYYRATQDAKRFYATAEAVEKLQKGA